MVLWCENSSVAQAGARWRKASSMNPRSRGYCSKHFPSPFDLYGKQHGARVATERPSTGAQVPCSSSRNTQKLFSMLFQHIEVCLLLSARVVSSSNLFESKKYFFDSKVFIKQCTGAPVSDRAQVPCSSSRNAQNYFRCCFPT